MSYSKTTRRRAYTNRRSQPLGPNESSDCGVYVLELNPSVLLEPLFLAKNPGHVLGQACLYVGMSSLPPEERASEHLQGTRNVSRIAHEYGIRLRMDLVKDQARVRRNWAMEAERRLAWKLRSQGFGVWQA